MGCQCLPSHSIQANLLIDVYPLASSLHILKQSPISFDQLSSSIHDANFILRLTVVACSGQIEDSEMRSLPVTLQASIREGLHCSADAQQKALDLLLWMSLVHCESGGDELAGYAVLSGAVGQLLLSLMHSCYVSGTRLLAHKCSRVLAMLYRSALHRDSSIPIWPRCLSWVCFMGRGSYTAPMLG